MVSYGSAALDESEAQFADVAVSDEALFEAIKANDINRVKYSSQSRSKCKCPSGKRRKILGTKAAN
jgi:hypothetical protein